MDFLTLINRFIINIW